MGGISMLSMGHLQTAGGVNSTQGGLKGHLGPQNLQLRKQRGDTIKEGTNTSDPLPQWGFGISLAPELR